MTNWKFHIGAVAIIVLLILGVFAIKGGLNPPNKEGEGGDVGPQFVQVVRASYGLNCNPLIERYSKYPKSSRKSDVPLEPIQPNNVLRRISDICNGTEYCWIVVSAGELRLDPYPGCLKELEVEYRCFSYDRLWKKSARDRQKLEINCHTDFHPPR